MSFPFTVEGYASLIRTLQGKGYEATSFHDANPNERHLILRHDIDMDIGAAEVLAEQERKLGVSAVYFVLVRSEIYNPNSASGRKGLESILNHGHEIGLHFDASLYPGASIEDLDRFCSEEREILELYLGGYETSNVSFHRPIKSLMGLEGRFAGCRHVYEPAFI
jgi:hypothetical protein